MRILPLDLGMLKLTLALATPLAVLSIGSVCKPFTPGAACTPNNKYITILSNSTRAECLGGCEAENANGCCWRSPKDGHCEWAPGCKMKPYEDPTVREATDCTLPPPPGPPPQPSPQQLHVAFGPSGSSSSILIQWALPIAQSLLPTLTSAPVLRLVDPRTNTTTVIAPQRNVSGPGIYTQLRVTLTNLSSSVRYAFSVGDLQNLLPPLHSTFELPPPISVDPDYAARLIFFGDIGWTDNQILTLMREECKAGAVDAVVIFGDMVYWDNGENENSFMRDISNMSTSVNRSIPVMTSPGNGDYDGGAYSRYKSQFAMPGDLYHSFNIGRTHIVALNSESIEYGHEASTETKTMLQWLDNDLRTANAVDTRAERPWLIVHWHRPAYSTGGTDVIPYQIFEPLMYKYGVDIVFAGHVHNQERTLPVFNQTAMPGPDAARPYADAQAPVYIVSGNPGNSEETSAFFKPYDPWTAWRSYHFGYTHLVAHNQSSLTIDFTSTNLGGAITDEVTIVKTKPCNFGDFCGKGKAQEEVKKKKKKKNQRVGAAPPSPSGTAAAAAAVKRIWAERNAAGGPAPAAQRTALLDLFHATGGSSSWIRSTNWGAATGPCDVEFPWYGVACVHTTERTLPDLWKLGGPSHGITALHLAGNGLTGTLPSSLGTALSTTIQLIDLSSNRVSGTVPASLFSNLPKLHTLYLGPRDGGGGDARVGVVSGTLPADIGISVPNLRNLGLSRTMISGSIPASLGDLPCHVVHASGGDPHTTTDPSVNGGQVACLIWLMNMTELSGAIPMNFCNATYNEVYLKGSEGLDCKQDFPCIKRAYGSSKCSVAPGAKCTPC